MLWIVFAVAFEDYWRLGIAAVAFVAAAAKALAARRQR
jgi:hypothetical protein